MPISVSCPGCAAKFNVKDEFAGKRAKCPKCGGPITIPAPAEEFEFVDDEPAPPPKSARPAAKARPRVVEDDDRPRKKPPVVVDEAVDDEDDAPRPKSKKRRDDDEDDRPRKKRRREDDDEPKKKKSALPLILGIVGGLFAVCGGGCAGVYFFAIKPAADRVKAELDDIEARLDNPKATQTNLAQVRSGMTLTQVEGILGKGFPAEEAVVDIATLTLPDDEANDRWVAKQKLGHVYQWENDETFIVVAFSGDPKTGGTVVGIAADIDDISTEPLVLPGGNTPPGGNQPPQELERGYPNPKVTRANLAQIRSGMTLAQVEGVLGKGFPALKIDTGVVTITLEDNAEERWSAKQQLGHVYSWENGGEILVVGFSSDPKAGGVVVGIAADIGNESTEPLKLPGEKGKPDLFGQYENPNVTPTNLAKLRGGMTLAQIEAVLGKGFPAQDADIQVVTEFLPNSDDAKARWKVKQEAKLVYCWASSDDWLLVAFSSDPKAGGTAVGIGANIGDKVTEPVKLP